MTTFCPHCGTQREPDWKYCRRCGSPQAKEPRDSDRAFCTECGSVIDDQWEFCAKCAAPTPIRRERKTPRITRADQAAFAEESVRELRREPPAVAAAAPQPDIELAPPPARAEPPPPPEPSAVMPEPPSAPLESPAVMPEPPSAPLEPPAVMPEPSPAAPESLPAVPPPPPPIAPIQPPAASAPDLARPFEPPGVAPPEPHRIDEPEAEPATSDTLDAAGPELAAADTLELPPVFPPRDDGGLGGPEALTTTPDVMKPAPPPTPFGEADPGTAPSTQPAAFDPFPASPPIPGTEPAGYEVDVDEVAPQLGAMPEPEAPAMPAPDLELDEAEAVELLAVNPDDVDEGATATLISPRTVDTDAVPTLRPGQPVELPDRAEEEGLEPEEPQPVVFRPVRMLGVWTQLAWLAVGLLSVATIAGLIVLNARLDDFRGGGSFDDVVAAKDAIDVWLRVILGVALVVALGLTVVWWYRIYRNQAYLEPEPLKPAPKVALVAWLVPIVNLVAPPALLHRAWRRAVADEDATQINWWIALWWIALLAFGVVVLTVGVAAGDAITVEASIDANTYAALAYGLLIISALAAVGVVSSVSDRQTERATHATRAGMTPALVR